MTKKRISAWVVVVCLLGAVSLRAQSASAGDANSEGSADLRPKVCGTFFVLVPSLST